MEMILERFEWLKAITPHVVEERRMSSGVVSSRLDPIVSGNDHRLVLSVAIEIARQGNVTKVKRRFSSSMEVRHQCH